MASKSKVPVAADDSARREPSVSGNSQPPFKRRKAVLTFIGTIILGGYAVLKPTAQNHWAVIGVIALALIGIGAALYVLHRRMDEI